METSESRISFVQCPPDKSVLARLGIFVSESAHQLVGEPRVFGVIPDIVNVQNVNDKTVFIEFADGTKEVAVLKDGDIFNLETGILICLTKKILSMISNGEPTGSSLYNKLVKYALTKVDATKKQRQAEAERAKQKRIRQHEARQEAKRKANAEREEKIKIQVEAYKRAVNEISNGLAEDFKKDLNDSLDKVLANLKEKGFAQ